MTELVVLVDDTNTPVGTADKETVHTTNTPLHRGFSLFVFHPQGNVLITRRADTKQTFPGVWTNAVCGHPAPFETVENAAIRRLEAELGITNVPVSVAVTDYRYQCVDRAGIMEYELCPILTAVTNKEPQPKDTEVSAWKWVSWIWLLTDMKQRPDEYSDWSKEEASILTQRKLLPTDLVLPQ